MLTYNYRDTSHPSSPEMVLVLWGFSMALVWCPAKYGSGRQMSRIFPSNKSMTFLTLRMNTLTFPQGDKESMAV